MNDYTVSIVIPVHHKWSLLSDILNDISKVEKNVDEFIIANNTPEDGEIKAGLASWADVLPIKTVISGPDSGFTINANNGLRHANKPLASRHITFLISNDVRIRGKFIEKTADVLFGAKKCLVGGKLLQHNTGWNEFDGIVFPYLEGWFLACTSDGWRDLGYFDEAYAPFDAEDMDLSTTALAKGYKLVPLNNPFITHAGGGTIGYNPAREAITRRNIEYFRKKWVK
jgi:GT2 family glycosyltransferase